MNKNELKKFLVGNKETLKDVLEKFNETAPLLGGKGVVVVIEDDGSLDGVVSDGDLRRYILSGGDLNLSVSTLTQKKECKFLTSNHSSHEILRLFELDLVLIPVVDKNLKLIDILVNNGSIDSFKQPKIFRARVPLRVSFAGGGTDMSYLMNEYDNAAVLTSSINRFCYATVIVRPDREIHLLSKDLGLSYVAKSLENIAYDGNLDLLKAAVKIIKPKFGFNLETYSEAGCGTGLGGSSALVGAIIGVLNFLSYDSSLDTYGIADLAYQAERIELKISGGWQDQYATVFGGINWIEFRKKNAIVHPLKIRNEFLRELEYNLIYFKFGPKRDSHKIQTLKETLAKENIEMNAAFMSRMNEIAIGMKESLLLGRLKKFGDYLDEAWKLKKLMSPYSTNENIDKIYKAAKKAGALGGKVLGAGQGGYMMLYASPLYHREIVSALAPFGCIQEHLRFNDTGLEIWSTEK